jgi:ribonucleoside-diphosphate reductase alpha chain
MQIQRRFTRADADPYEGLEFEPRATEIRNPDGSVVFAMDNVMAPRSWSQVAVDVLAQKYFRKAGLPLKDADGNPVLDSKGRPMTGSESDARQVFHRLAGCWTHWGREYGYFDTEDDAQTFYSEMCAMLANQMSAPNSPQWFNTGLHWAYGITGPAQGHWYCDPETGELTQSDSAYEHPQPHACFIQSVGRPRQRGRHHGPVGARSAAVQVRVGHRFQLLPAARAQGEPLSGGGRSSGLMSFLKIGDRAAGAIKSGGTTRRAAKMVVPRSGSSGHRALHLLEGHARSARWRPWSPGRRSAQKFAWPTSWPAAFCEGSDDRFDTEQEPEQSEARHQRGDRANGVPDGYIKRIIQFARQGYTRVLKFDTYDTDWDSARPTSPSRARTRTTRVRVQRCSLNALEQDRRLVR